MKDVHYRQEGLGAMEDMSAKDGSLVSFQGEANTAASCEQNCPRVSIITMREHLVDGLGNGQGGGLFLDWRKIGDIIDYAQEKRAAGATHGILAIQKIGLCVEEGMEAN